MIQRHLANIYITKQEADLKTGLASLELIVAETHVLGLQPDLFTLGKWKIRKN